MRIAHLDTGREWRGGQAQVLHLMRGLRERGHESTLFAPEAPLARRARAEGFPVVRWKPWLDWDPVAILTAARGLGRVRADLVHCHTARAHGSGVPAARLAGLPVVVSRRVPVAVGGHLLSRLKYRGGVARYLCVSAGVRDAMRRAGIPDSALAVVPSGVAAREESRGAGAPVADLRARIGAGADAVVVGTVAALTPEKDHAMLLDAAVAVVARHPGTHWVWMGEGPCRPALERRRGALGLERHVHLLGFVEDAQGFLPQLTLFALPSRFEGLGNAILEAQAAGVPVVATAVGGVPELIEDGVSGRLVAPGDPGAMAAALIEAIERPARRAAWAERSGATARVHSASRMVDLTIEQYESVLAARR